MRERRQPSPRPWPQQRSKAGGGQGAAKKITSRIKQAVSASEVLGVIQEEHQNPAMDLIAICAAWTQLAGVQRSINQDVVESSYLSSLLDLSHQLLESPVGQVREVTGIFLKAAKLPDRLSYRIETLWTSLARSVQVIVNELDAQGVANVIYAIATLPTDGAASTAVVDLLPALARRVPAVAPKMTEQAVANVVWATGQFSANPSHYAISRGLRELLPSLVAQASVVLPTAKPQGLANTCWGLALSGYYDANYFQSVAEKVQDESEGWKPAGAQLDLPSVLCSFGRLKAIGHEDMLAVAANKLSPMISRINDWGLCALAWSYQQLDVDDSFLDFRQGLQEEVARRHLSETSLERSRLGPENWRQVRQSA